MLIIFWIIFGGVAGWLASVFMGTDYYQGTLTDIGLGILGALIGGLLMEVIGLPGITGLNLYSFIVAVVGACLVILIGRGIRSATYEIKRPRGR